MFSVMSYNVLAQGFTSPFAYAADHLDWAKRRARLLSRLLPKGGLRFGIIALQEVQSTSRGWGRLAGGEDDDDHARWFQLKLADAGYRGAYAVFDDDPRSSKSAPSNDRPSVGSGSWDGKPYNGAWPVTTRPPAPTASPMLSPSKVKPVLSSVDRGAGGRLGVALFWDAAQFDEVASRTVSLSTHFMDLTREATPKNDRGWYIMMRWNTALLVLLKHKASGMLVLAACTHMPTPSGEDADEPVRDGGEGADAGDYLLREARKGRVQQVQIAEAICVEASALLSDLGLLGRVPVILAGDFNARPGDPVYALLTNGSLPPATPELHPRTTDGGKAARKERARAAADKAAATAAATEAPMADDASVMSPVSAASTPTASTATSVAKPVPLDISLAQEVVLPYAAPTCGRLGPFRSAYAAAHGAEPETTTYRLFGHAAVPAAAAAVEAPTDAAAIGDPATATKIAKGPAPAASGTAAAPSWVASGHFSGTLDYIFFANPAPLAGAAAGGSGSASGSAGPPAAELAIDAESTPALLSEAALLASLAGEAFPALPCSMHPSDHLPLAVTFKLLPKGVGAHEGTNYGCSAGIKRKHEM